MTSISGSGGSAGGGNLSQLAVLLGIPITGLTTSQVTAAVADRLTSKIPLMVARQQFGLRQRLTTANLAVLGMIIGNSIPPLWGPNLMTKLATYSGFSSASWTTAVPNYAVGGAQLSQAAFLVSPQALNATYSDPRGWAAQVNPLMNSGKKFVIIGGARNEAPDVLTAGFQKGFRAMLDNMVDLCLAAGMDVILTTDPMQIDPVTGLQTAASLAADEIFAGIQRDIAASKGVSLVDELLYTKTLYQQGIDLRLYLPDGTHPADGSAGSVDYRSIIAQHQMDVMLTSPLEPATKPSKLDAGTLIVNWGAQTGSDVTTTSPYSKKVVTGIGSVRTLAASGGSYTMSPLMAYTWTNLLLQPGVSGINMTIGALTATTQNAGSGSTNHREQTLFAYNTTIYNPNNASPVMSNSSATAQEFVGLLYMAPMMPGQTPLRIAGATASSGTWTDITTADGNGVSGPDTDGTYIEYEFWGTGVALRLGRGPAAPILDISVDGTVVTTFDAYAASQSITQRGLFAGLEYGRHVVRVTVNGRNGSSTGTRDIRVAGLIQFDSRSTPDAWTFILGDRGLTAGTEPNAYYLPLKYTDAIITKTLVGTPVLTLNRTTGRIEVTGGTAVVRIIR